MTLEQLCDTILSVCRVELCQRFPSLNVAFSYLKYQGNVENAICTDGQVIMAGKSLVEMYYKNPQQVKRGYLHILLHCIYLHLLIPKGIDTFEWDLACDICVEKLIEDLQEEILRVDDPVRNECLLKLQDYVVSPNGVLKLLREDFFHYSKETLAQAFLFDDHSTWRQISQESTRMRWEFVMPDGGDIGKGNRGNQSYSEETEPILMESKPHDFRKYLRKYMSFDEAIEQDEDSFDYIYYHVGMEHFGNTPLLEPLEYKEVWRLDEIAIAIDTSGSCSKELIAKFLNETYAILSSRENFFQRMKVVFFQCDCVLQDTAIIRTPEQWKNYSSTLKIKGRGGTDFCPVFREIEKMRNNKQLKKPKVLLYFTDGDGVYPSVRPDYDTLFVVTKEKQKLEMVPKWAKVLVLD